MKKWLYAAGALLIAVGFAVLGMDGRRAKKAEASRDKLILDESKKAQDKAKKAGAKADKLQADAAQAAEVGRAAIDRVGTNDESMRDILDSWRADRVQ